MKNQRAEIQPTTAYPPLPIFIKREEEGEKGKNLKRRETERRERHKKRKKQKAEKLLLSIVGVCE